MTDQEANKLDKINEYLEDVENLSKDLVTNINKIQEINKPWVSKLNVEKIQKENNLGVNSRGI